MKIQVPNIQFTCFSDGICDIYSEDEEANKNYKFKGLGFEERVLGFKRHFAAKSAQVEANAVIRIPKVLGINNHDTLEIYGLGKYEIQLVQNIKDSNPPSIDLTLRQLEMFEVKSNE